MMDRAEMDHYIRDAEAEIRTLRAEVERLRGDWDQAHMDYEHERDEHKAEVERLKALCREVWLVYNGKLIAADAESVLARLREAAGEGGDDLGPGTGYYREEG